MVKTRKLFIALFAVMTIFATLWLVSINRKQANAQTLNGFQMGQGVSFRFTPENETCAMVYTATIPKSTFNEYSNSGYKANLVVVPYSYIENLRASTSSTYSTARTHLTNGEYAKAFAAANLSTITVADVEPILYNNVIYLRAGVKKMLRENMNAKYFGIFYLTNGTNDVYPSFSSESAITKSMADLSSRLYNRGDYSDSFYTDKLTYYIQESIVDAINKTGETSVDKSTVGLDALALGVSATYFDDEIVTCLNASYKKANGRSATANVINTLDFTKSVTDSSQTFYKVNSSDSTRVEIKKVGSGNISGTLAGKTVTVPITVNKFDVASAISSGKAQVQSNTNLMFTSNPSATQKPTVTLKVLPNGAHVLTQKTLELPKSAYTYSYSTTSTNAKTTITEKTDKITVSGGVLSSNLTTSFSYKVAETYSTEFGSDSQIKGNNLCYTYPSAIKNGETINLAYSYNTLGSTSTWNDVLSSTAFLAIYNTANTSDYLMFRQDWWAIKSGSSFTYENADSTYVSNDFFSKTSAAIDADHAYALGNATVSASITRRTENSQSAIYVYVTLNGENGYSWSSYYKVLCSTSLSVGIKIPYQKCAVKVQSGLNVTPDNWKNYLSHRGAGTWGYAVSDSRCHATVNAYLKKGTKITFNKNLSMYCWSVEIIKNPTDVEILANRLHDTTWINDTNTFVTTYDGYVAINYRRADNSNLSAVERSELVNATTVDGSTTTQKYSVNYNSINAKYYNVSRLTETRETGTTSYPFNIANIGSILYKVGKFPAGTVFEFTGDLSVYDWGVVTLKSLTKDAGEIIKDSGWINSNTKFSIESEAYVAINIKNKNNTTAFTQDMINGFVGKIKCYEKGTYNYVNNCMDVGYGTWGVSNVDNNRIHLMYSSEKFPAGSIVKCSIDVSTYNWSVLELKTTNRLAFETGDVILDTTWQTFARYVTLHEGYIAVNFRHADNSQMSESEIYTLINKIEIIRPADNLSYSATTIKSSNYTDYIYDLGFGTWGISAGHYGSGRDGTRGHILYNRYFKAGTVISYSGNLNTYKWSVELMCTPYNDRLEYRNTNDQLIFGNALYDSTWLSTSSHTTTYNGYIALNVRRDDGVAINTTELLDFVNAITVNGQSVDSDVYLDSLLLYTFDRTSCTYTTMGIADFNVSSVNHRGYSGLAPENTITAYEYSKYSGYERVECDVCFTSDGYKVLLHDGSIDRTSNGTGNIGSMTFAQARTYSFGSWLSEKYFSAVLIPSFDEFLEFCRVNKIHPYIEIKTGGTSQQHVELVNSVKAAGMQDLVTWISFDFNALKTINGAYSKARLGFLIGTADQDTINYISSFRNGENEVFIDTCVYDAEQIQRCKNANYLTMEIWTINGEDVVLNMDDYVSGVTSDTKLAERVLQLANIFGITSI